MKRKSYRIMLLGVFALLGGCVTPAPPPVVIKKPLVKEPPRPQITADALKVLTQIDDMQATLRQLRNAVDLQQYGQQNSKRRQRQLYDDLDRRLRVLERSSRQTSRGSTMPALAGPETVPTVTTNTSQPAEPSNLPGPPVPDSGRISIAAQAGVDVGNIGPGISSATANTEAAATVTPGATPGATPGVSATGPALSAEAEALAQTAYDSAFGLLRKSRYQEAIVAFGKVVQDYPTSTVADDAQYWMAESYYVTREFEQALLGFRTVAVRYQASPKAPQALLKIGYIQYDMGAYERARQTLQDVVARFPESRVAIAAKARLEKMQREGR